MNPDYAWERMRAEFPFLPDRLFLNHAGVSPLPLRAQKAMKAAVDGYEEGVLSGVLVEKPPELRRALAALVGGPAGGIALVPNTSTAVSLIAAGLRLREGEEILVPEGEYPANAYGWLRQRERGIKVTFVPEREGKVRAEDLLAACGKKTRLIAASWVQFGSGYRLDAEALAQGCRQKGVLLFIDAAQGLGAFPFEAAKWGVTFAAGSGWKWLFGPAGTGWMYLAPETLELVEPVIVGAESMDKALDDVAYAFEFKADAARFEPGGSPGVLWAGLSASAQWLLDLGPEAVGRGILKVTDALAAAVARRGWTVVSPREKGEGSGILACQSPRVPAKEALRTLHGAGIEARVRRGWLRLSPHAYNTEQEMEKVAALLPKG
jgi:selenocysteine lyase/cysteine desulfurase